MSNAFGKSRIAMLITSVEGNLTEYQSFVDWVRSCLSVEPDLMPCCGLRLVRILWVFCQGGTDMMWQ